MDNKYKTIGILGGMGPEATLDLYRWIIKLTPAAIDQEHIPVLINSLPQIPDRTKYLLGGNQNPLPYLIKAATALQRAGADFIIIPCNTAHAFINQLSKQISIPIISMIDIVVSDLLKNYPSIKKVGLLATTGTIKTKIYQNKLDRAGFTTITPQSKVQKSKVMESIYGKGGIKAGANTKKPISLLYNAGNHLVHNGAQAIILGCTEISMVMHDYFVPVPVINPAKLLAETSIRLATEKKHDIIHYSYANITEENN